ncbi:hypothetical protein S7711_06491 [Stachybotrys chartarum IBT 7711]|uniref:Transcription factor domain-containing protein n=1 Tax=Stachybotrys chartarum (strain CBS 109288 / IBT 7711) TaxID=1280523 RepID=A0A084BB75_STACB|nr:hypothetical protein S7711_06491 [Stachybotrys chartarum IBT 7711]
MHFQFIDHNSELCHAAKRLIRSHAAKEKNLGRTIVRPSRSKILKQRRELATVFPFSVPSPRSTSSPESEQDLGPVVSRQIGDGLSVLSLMATLSSEPRELVQKAVSLFGRVHYLPELCKAFEPHKGPPSMWFQLALEDEAYFHVFVAMSAVSFNDVPMEEDDPMLAVRHLNKTFFLTNQRLSRDDAVSNASIAVVVMMAQYERQRERYIKGLNHLDGLQRMVEMRGGISQLARDEPSLCQKILRLDLDYALYLGTDTRFTTTDAVDACGVWSLPRNNFANEHERGTADLGQSTQLSVELQYLAGDITHLAWLLNDVNAGCRPALTTRAFHGTLLPIGYRLVKFSPLGASKSVCLLENAVHLGLVAFILPFMYRFDGKVPDIPLLSQLIRSAIQENLSTDKDKDTQEILLWILLVGAASVFKQPVDEWIVPLGCQLMRSLHLHNWEAVSQAMENYPWIDLYHNEICQNLFTKQSFCDGVLTAPGFGDEMASLNLPLHTLSYT